MGATWKNISTLCPVAVSKMLGIQAHQIRQTNLRNKIQRDFLPQKEYLGVPKGNKQDRFCWNIFVSKL